MFTERALIVRPLIAFDKSSILMPAFMYALSVCYCGFYLMRNHIFKQLIHFHLSSANNQWVFPLILITIV
jgi:hypothetical protein